MDPTPQRQHQQNQHPKPLAHKKLPPEVNRILYVRNLPFNITDEDMYDIFGKYGAIRQIRIGQTRDTKGTAYVVYEDIYDAKSAVDSLSGFNVGGRYIVVLYYQPKKNVSRLGMEEKKMQIEELKKEVGEQEAN